MAKVITKADADMIAAFMAKRGVTKIAAGEAAMTERDMHKAVRSEHRVNALINQRHVAAVDHLGREFVVNGLGERIN